MKLIPKILLGLVFLYMLFWIGLAAYFNYAERYKGLLEANLSSIFKRSVSIEQVHTAWKGLSPIIQISGFKVAGDTAQQAAFAFKSLSAEFSPISILRLWPQLTEFAVAQPELEIVSLPGNQLQVAGIKLSSNRSGAVNPKRLISWMLNHKSAVWLNGEVVWRRHNGQEQRYTDTSFVYQREGEHRQINAATITPKGPFAFKAQSNGDVLEVENWDASLEVLGDQGQRLLASDDLSLVVQNGKGSLQLKTLDVQHIRDFLLITGLGEAASWVLDSQLSGRLHDMRFDFSGPLLQFSDWSLTALASEVGFLATDTTPAMSNLGGKVNASASGGKFEFSANNTVFDWPQWFDYEFLIEQASGQFNWFHSANGALEVELENGFFEDDVTKIWDLNARCSLDPRSKNVSTLAQLFTVESVADLSFERGRVVQQNAPPGQTMGPMYLDAKAKFEVKNLDQVKRYLPNDARLGKFRNWWAGAFLQGVANNGAISYQGEVSRNAIKVGKARLEGQADFSNVELDYGFQSDWPKLLKGKGQLILENELLSILPEQAWLEEDPVAAAKVSISSIFDQERELELQASMTIPLPRVMQFLFNGPLLNEQQRQQSLPITAQSGQVSAKLSVSIPLRNVRDARVTGSAEITDGHFTLPQGVRVNDASAHINFTENSAESNNIKASFLDGIARAKLVTTKAAQPPKLQVIATGSAQVQKLQPWLGEHILSRLDGTTAWQGNIDIDESKVNINVASDLRGLTVNTPDPLAKSAKQAKQFSFSMQTGGKNTQTKLGVEYGSHFAARFAGDAGKANDLFDNALILLGDQIDPDQHAIPPGVNILVEDNQLDLDSWLTAIIDIAQLETESPDNSDTAFLDAMRTVTINSNDPLFMGRQFGAMELSAISVDGAFWIASLNGDNVNGTLQAEPRADVGVYRLNLSRLHIVEPPPSLLPPEPIDRSLRPDQYPAIELTANSFRLSDKPLGRLQLSGAPDGDVWKLLKFELSDHGIHTTANGQWVNNEVSGSLTSFDIETNIDEAGHVLNEMDFHGIVKKGHGKFMTRTTWLGAPHEFDFARLNGEFDLRIKDGELVQVEPGGGKLLGLLNFNVIARRLLLDFRDVTSSGLQFDRMRYVGVLADGEAIMRDAFILTPAAYIKLEGKLDLDTELIDMELHVSPELAGNLTLLTALANPAAGALVFLTQQLFKDQMRSASFKSYRALGTWKDFELVEVEGHTLESERRNSNKSKPNLNAPGHTIDDPIDQSSRTSVKGNLHSELIDSGSQAENSEEVMPQSTTTHTDTLQSP